MSIFGKKIPGPPVPGVHRICAIVPVIDEEERIEAVLTALRGEEIEEVIVVDGGSRDRSRAIAERYADRVLVETGGLAKQLNGGASEANGDVLLFLYADSTVPRGLRTAIERTLVDPNCLGGAFRLGFDGDSGVFRVIAWGANLRTRLGIGPFGDQGIFVRRSGFESVGGYREDCLLEDLDLVRRLRRRGSIRVQRETMTTSSRRWRTDGVVRTALRHWWVLAQHLAGGAKNRRARTKYSRWRRGGRS